MNMMKKQMEFVGPPDLVNEAGARVGNKPHTGSRYRMKCDADVGVQYERKQ